MFARVPADRPQPAQRRHLQSPRRWRTASFLVDRNILEAMSTDRQQRAAARRHWPVRAFRLGEEPADDLRANTTAAERLEMVWLLTVDAWTLSGREIPGYARHESPVRVIRSGIRAAETDEGNTV